MGYELFDEPQKHRNIKHYDKNTYVDSAPLQYLNRPKKLEHLGLTDYRLNYHVARKANQEDMTEFDYNEDYEAHKYQGVLKSKNKKEYVPVFNIWAFPDAAKFNGSLLDENVPVNSTMEECALEVLVAYCPHRKLEDLEKNGSHVEKFREWHGSLNNQGPEFQQMDNMLRNLQQLQHLEWRTHCTNCSGD